MMDNPLLIFDCDGVLIDSEAVYLEVEFDFLRSKDIEVARDWYVGEFMALAQDKWRAKLSDLLLEKTGTPLTNDDYTALKSVSRRRVLEEVQPIAGVDTLLKSMAAPRCCGVFDANAVSAAQAGTRRACPVFRRRRLFRRHGRERQAGAGPVRVRSR
jgi:beta-phosphoglucomutase-like phosphatase (HAD superfamily)